MERRSGGGAAIAVAVGARDARAARQRAPAEIARRAWLVAGVDLLLAAGREPATRSRRRPPGRQDLELGDRGGSWPGRPSWGILLAVSCSSIARSSRTAVLGLITERVNLKKPNAATCCREGRSHHRGSLPDAVTLTPRATGPPGCWMTRAATAPARHGDVVEVSIVTPRLIAVMTFTIAAGAWTMGRAETTWRWLYPATGTDTAAWVHLDDRTIYVVGTSGTVLEGTASNRGDRAWTLISPGVDMALTRVSAVGGTLFAGSTDGRLFVLPRGESAWRSRRLPMRQVATLHAISDGILLVSDWFQLYATSDRGATWRTLPTGSDREVALSASAIWSRSALDFYVGGQGNAGKFPLLHTRDGGRTFETIALSGPSAGSVTAINGNAHTVLVVLNGFDSSAILLRSKDEHTWQAATLPVTPVRLIGAYGENGAVVSDGKRVVWSNDGGDSWGPPINLGTSVTAMTTTADGTIVVAGIGTVLRVTPKGEVMTELHPARSATPTIAFAPTDEALFALGETSLLKIRGAPPTVTELTIAGGSGPYAAIAARARRVAVLGRDGRVYESVDAGDTWTGAQALSAATATSRVFVGTDGTLVASNGTGVAMKHPGEAWNVDPSFKPRDLLYAPFGFFAVDGPTLKRSADGRQWQDAKLRYRGSPLDQINLVAADDFAQIVIGQLVRVSAGQTAYHLQRSLNGWMFQDFVEFPLSDTRQMWMSGQHVVGTNIPPQGSGRVLLISNDFGNSWLNVAVPVNNINDAAAETPGHELVVAAPSGGLLISSPIDTESAIACTPGYEFTQTGCRVTACRIGSIYQPTVGCVTSQGHVVPPPPGPRTASAPSPQATPPPDPPTPYTFVNHSGMVLYVYYQIAGAVTVDCRNLADGGAFAINEQRTYSIPKGQAGWFRFQRVRGDACDSANNKFETHAAHAGGGVIPIFVQ